MDQPLIQVEKLSYAYPDGKQALKDISFQVASGQKVALAGANGAGKSTLLMLLCGVLDQPSNGSVRLFGLSPTRANLKEIRRRLGLVFQNPDDQLFCPTLADDVAFGPRNLRLPAEEVTRRTAAALAAVGLEGFDRRSPFHLSLGEKRRAAIATVLAMQPELLALDEPTSMLDPKGKRELTDLLKTLGGTQIIVSHDLSMIAGLCDRMIVLSHGRVVADAAPHEVLADEGFLLEHGLA